MSSTNILGSLKNHKFTALNNFLPQGYAVVATFPNKSNCEIKVAVRASEEELEGLDKYYWSASSISDTSRRELHLSLTENRIPTDKVDGLDSSIESDARLAVRGAEKGKTYRSPDTTSTSGTGCAVGVLTSIILLIILAQLPIDEGWWSLLSVAISIGAGILLYKPFQKSHSTEMQEIAEQRKTVDRMGARLLDAEFYASTVATTASDLRTQLDKLSELGLSADENVPIISSMLSDYFDTASKLEKARSTISSAKKVLKGLSDSEIKSDPDLSGVLDDLNKATETKIESFRLQSDQELSLSKMSQELERQVRLANAKLNAVKYRYEKDD